MKKNAIRSEKISQNRKNFIHKNESFRCGQCGKINKKAPKTCRNHCRYCLFSRHVDKEIPGDRLSTCQSLMAPAEAHFNSKKGWQILHRCLKCGKEILNKAAEDDDIDALTRLIQFHNRLNA